MTPTPTPAAWRNKREPKLVRSEPPHPDYAHLWEPLYASDTIRSEIAAAEKRGAEQREAELMTVGMEHLNER